MSLYKRKIQVFLCHASQDKLIVRELYQRLTLEGWIDPWLDEEKLLPGMNWDMEIEKAVEATDVVIVCLSNRSISKDGYIQRELKFVLDIALEKPEGIIFVIPLRLDDCQVPRRLRAWQYVDYFPSDKVITAYSRLLKSFENRANVLGLDIAEIKNRFEKKAEEKVQEELRDRIDREAREKTRREEEKILRQEAEERAYSEKIEGGHEESDELFMSNAELLKRKRTNDEAKKREKHKQEEVGTSNYSIGAIDKTRKSDLPINLGIIVAVVFFCLCCLFNVIWVYGDAISQFLGG
jgi:hypothetical protein